jgi:hypothetical protein
MACPAFLLPVPAMTGLPPSSTRGFVVEVETTVSPPSAVPCTGALEGRLGRPGKGALFGGKARQALDDLIHSERRGAQWISMVIVHDQIYRGIGLTSDPSLLPAGRVVKRPGKNDEDAGAVN